ncbi:diacylglycerol acyltransferase [Entophlyctis helioformis]|nr:diacylglycerol acyltransferase [Entophlyctis helioformis]
MSTVAAHKQLDDADKPLFAPLDVPLERRAQTAAVAFWMALLPICLAIFLLAASSSWTLPLALAYVVFLLLDPAPEMGARRLPWVRRLPVWRGMAGYFPVSLVKTADLDPSKNYVFGYHPHGIISLGAWINFATEATKFSELFHGIDIRLLTLPTNFNIPVWRELILSLGIASSSRRSCDNVVTKGPGHSIMLVVGGAAEALYAFPHTNDLVIKKRYGFVNVALRSGASLVPVFSFGENDIWDQVPNPKGSTLRKVQSMFQRVATFSPPLFHGRGIFQYAMGIMPYRRPIVSVVGNPIDCPKIPNPTREETAKYHKLYLEELQRVYDTYKDVYAADRIKDLTFIEA